MKLSSLERALADPEFFTPRHYRVRPNAGLRHAILADSSWRLHAVVVHVRVEDAPSLIAFLSNGFVPHAVVDGFVVLKEGGSVARRKPKKPHKPAD